jgi:superfamily II DNA or RNA helicase
MITWRPYQIEIIESVFSGWLNHASLLVVAATGAGKTNVLWGVVDRYLIENPGSRILVLAHRKELIEQPKARLEQFWPQRAHQAGIVMADVNECHRPITIATVQTVGHKNGKRLNEILRYGHIDLLIVDEAHHCSAASYQNVIANLKAANPLLKHLGVTATPERADKKSLAETYQHEAANVGVMRLIEEGHLCEPKVHGVKTNIDLSWVSVHGSGGNRDYNQQQLVAAVETSDCFKVVVKTHMEKVGDRPTIAFVPSVAGAYALADLLKAQGIRAAAADGTTPKAEREALLRDFKAGRYTTLVNVALWTEGLDLPHLECCHLVRPTKSDALYLQMVGRVLRNHPGKVVADIFDYQPVGERNLDQRLVALGLKKRKPMSMGERVGGGGMAEKSLHKAGDQIEYVMLNYFNKRKENWLDIGGWRIVGLGKGDDNIDRSMAISPDGSELWAVWRREGERWNQARCYMTGSFDEVSVKAQEFINRYGSVNLTRKKATWRHNAPSEKMVKFGESLKVFQPSMNAGQLSDAINQKLVMQAIRRAGMAQAA